MKSYFKIFEFIVDEKLKKNLILDYKEVLTCINRQAYKGAVVLAGGIVEAILIDRTLNLSQKTKQKVRKMYSKCLPKTKKKIKNIKIEKMELYYLIQTLNNLKIITSPQANRCDILRDYRNLIHPFKKGDRPKKSDAISVEDFLNDLISDFGKSVVPKIDKNKATLFLTHTAYKEKREQPVYREILELFCKKKGTLKFEELLNLPSFQSKKNPSKSLIASLNYLKNRGLCVQDFKSWKGYPIKRFEIWTMNKNNRKMVEDYLLKRSQGFSQPITSQAQNIQKLIDFTKIEIKILSTLYKYQKQSFGNDISKRWTFIITPYFKEEYPDYLDGISRLLKKGFIAISPVDNHCMITNEGLDYIEKNKSIYDKDLAYTF